MNHLFRTRLVQPADMPFLWTMLWEAAAVDDRVRALGEQVAISLPDIARYLDGWGRFGDSGVIACSEAGRPLGAAWVRLFQSNAPGYGFVGSDIPELAIGVVADARGQGVGGMLLDAVLLSARTHGYRAISLAVSRQNPSRRLYQRKGFLDADVSDPEDDGLTMIAWL